MSEGDVRDSMKLVADLTGQSARDLAWTRDRIEDDLRQDVIKFAQWRAFVVSEVSKLCHEPYSPNPMFIMDIVEVNASSLDMIAERYLKGSDLEDTEVKTCLPFTHSYSRAHGREGDSRLYKICSICGYTKRA